MSSLEENQLLTRTGPGTPMGALIRRYWVPVLLSEQLPGPDSPPVRVTVLGERLVAFRDTGGSVGLLGQHCPHRGASLFFGRNEGQGLRCAYHGWKFNAAGACVDMPNEPAESSFKDRIRHVAYPCAELGGVVWTYMGPPELRPGLPELDWTLVPESQRYVTRHLQECNWLQAVEGGFDVSHIPFLHRRGRYNPIPTRYDTIATDFGFIAGSSRDADDDPCHWNTELMLMPFHKVISRFAGPDAPIGAHVWVPIDDELCMNYSIEYRPDRPLRDDEMAPSRDWLYIHAETAPGSDRALLNRDNDYGIDRALQRSGASYTGIRGVSMQDCSIQESMGAITDRSAEHFHGPARASPA